MPERVDGAMPAWQRFILEHGWRANVHDLAHVLGKTTGEVAAVRRTSACARLPNAKPFAELFALWHGRAPSETDWPAPQKLGKRDEYRWQAPEIALLATLVGQMGPVEIAQVLTARLRKLTHDPAAERTTTAVQVRMNQMGLQTTDVVGGITIAQAAREIGSLATIQQSIASGRLRARRSGRLWVIPQQAWVDWKAEHTFAPEGYVPLASLREALALRSDKLSEFARMGYVPTAVRCNPYGKGPSTQFGTWYISPKTAKKLLADRRAGRAMPWHGKPMMDNLKTTFKLWQQRQHPKDCKTCAEIWGEKGAPKDFDDYVRQYPPLAHGAKRHLTMPWSLGMSVDEVARHARREPADVVRAIENGALACTEVEGRQYVSRTDATRWVARHCPSGDGARSWIAIATACKQYLFTARELRDFIADGTLRSKEGTNGAMRGIVYVPRQQCAQLREKLGFTETEGASRLGITVPRLRVLLEGVDWREAEKIPLVTLQAVRKRLESREGYDVEEAAAALGTSVEWVRERIEDGTARVSRAKWDRRRRYLTAPMLERLRTTLRAPAPPTKLGDGFVTLSEAALDAGVSNATLCRWGNAGEVTREHSPRGWAYHLDSVRSRARRYWETVRFRRAVPPAWLRAETAPTA